MNDSLASKIGAAKPEGTSVSGGTIRTCIRGGSLYALILVAMPWSHGQSQDANGLFRLQGATPSPYSQRQQLISSLPMERLTREAQERILGITSSPTLYRRLPTQAIDCDRDMFLFLSRNPEVLVGIWDLMGITKVQTRRTAAYQFEAEDGNGTKCQVDLVYGDPATHIYVAEGSYDGKLVAKPIHGRGVFVLRSSYVEGADGRSTVTGTLDSFVQIESLGADLIARTLSGLIGRSADHNFVETAQFIAQVSQAAEHNPSAMIDVANRIPQVTDSTRREFVKLITSLAAKGVNATSQTAKNRLEYHSR